jgi:histidinol dehydrogenase
MATKTTGVKPLRVLTPEDADFPAAWQSICRREAVLAEPGVDDEVAGVLARIRDGGDRALRGWVDERYDVEIDRLEVTNAEWDAACEAVDPADRAALGKAAMRIREFHKKRIPGSWEMREEGGGYMGQRVRPLGRVAICAPAEGELHPSALIMNATPPSVVEVPEIFLAAPPRPDGTVRPEILMAARIAGVHRVFKMAGAGAIGAFAYGTLTVPRVDKIVGPGDPETDTAKRLVSGVVGVAGSSGPRELCIVADKTATPAWLAADLLSHAEAGGLSQTVFITHMKGQVTRVQEQIVKQLKALGKTRVARQSLASAGVIVLTRSLDESLALADEYAAEHLVLAVDAPELAAKSIQNAGAIFMGHYTPVAVGDYLAGPNDVLPAGGTARFESPLGVDDFLKRTSFVKFEPPKLRELGAEVVRLAGVEGLSGHGTSVELRLQKIRRARREREQAREAEL